MSNQTELNHVTTISSAPPPRVIAPIEGVGLIVWWIVEEIVTNTDTFWQFSRDSLAMVLSQVSWLGHVIWKCKI